MTADDEEGGTFGDTNGVINSTPGICMRRGCMGDIPLSRSLRRFVGEDPKEPKVREGAVRLMLGLNPAAAAACAGEVELTPPPLQFSSMIS